MSLEFDDLQSVVNAVYERHRAAPGGENASYIPYLAQVPSDLCALAVRTPDGKLTSSKWAAIAKCSPDTALRDVTP